MVKEDLTVKYHKIQKNYNQSGAISIKYIVLFVGIVLFLTSAPFWVPSFLKGKIVSYHFFQNEVVVLGLLLLGGYIGGEVANFLKFPAVTGYIVMGIFLGPSVLNFVPSHMIQEFNFIEVLGLSLVALIIGGDLHLDTLKRIGHTVVVITIVQAFSTFMLVSLSLKYILKIPIQTTLFLGAIASATAPAATVAVIKQYKAKGPLTDSLLAIVAMDDAACIILFSLVAAVVGVLNGGKEKGLLIHIALPLWEIGGSIALGVIMGTILTLILRKKIRQKHEMMIILIGAAFLFGEIAEIMGLSALLFNMTAGLTLVNLDPNPLFFKCLEDIELPVFIVFFSLAGATLNLKILLKNWAIGLLFVLSRAVGKIGGVYIGGKASGANKYIQKYLGFAMLPQAGVAIALALKIQTTYPDLAGLITSVVLASVAINELVGPLGTKFAITSAGEIHFKKEVRSNEI